ncbi:threonine/homoserine/homoserine lactone efflux protein [Rhodobium orientis]|uniref:Lysine transporter LysE n=1 Tax=Rhodobium orientis TaxID=34017 RepID=A0A327JVN8_9HYPH|nr:LysE family transporter [Rhodobium orientis]MBB4304061.1 threonine/homoserine/homoserine lactone efflux protein [Rhodobium orientis]MBK5950734.1 hypothetical protein [Rhodobium orientis]RAI29594.1 hypothetical protein CH339_02810 [Rhodobium orientis]
MSAFSLEGLVIGWVALLAAAAAPGPNLLAVAASALGNGRRFALAVAAGVAAGTFFWALAAVLGLTLVFSAYPWSTDILRIAGGVYLIVVGARAIRAGLAGNAALMRNGAASASIGNSFLRGFVVVGTNPKAMLLWTSIAALVVVPGMPLAVAVLFAGVSMAISFAVYAIYALVFSLPRLRAGYRGFANQLEIAFGAVFCLFGARLLASR